MSSIPKFVLSLVTTTLLATTASEASLIVTYAEAPDDVNSRLSGTTVFNFNQFTPGTYTDVEWEGVGEFDHIQVLDADQFGGAVDPGFQYGSPYSVQLGAVQTTLTLTTPHAYFGFWWSAGDSQNILEFFNGEELVGRFTTATLLDHLDDTGTNDYHGNPRDRNLTRHENFAFINFFGQEGSTWDRIVLSNGGGTGFESDNYTDRERPWTEEEDGPMPGIQLAIVEGTNVNVTAVPETGSAVFGAVGMFFLLTRRSIGGRQRK